MFFKLKTVCPDVSNLLQALTTFIVIPRRRSCIKHKSYKSLLVNIYLANVSLPGLDILMYVRLIVTENKKGT